MNGWGCECVMPINNPKIGQGPAIELTAEDRYKDDKIGFTNPNLHRRVDPRIPSNSYETSPRGYNIGIYGLESYRTTTVHLYDEASEESEIP